MPYDVVHRDTRFNLANVSHIHHGPAGDPGAAGGLAVLGSCRSSRLLKAPVHAISSRGASPAARRVVMKVHLLLQFRMVLKEKCCV